MASADGPGHLLSLKVMRVSRPSLASAWQPFYSSSPSFSAHSTASILSLQGNTPLPGHPKTLRDLTYASEMLTLPSSFGAIQLGETFSSCLCINNEAKMDVEAVSMRVEMQTVTSKVVLAEFGGSDYTLAAGGTLESVVHHEIKELGQHVLACAVTYRMPPHRSPVVEPTPGTDPTLQTFRKFYKFAVTNPLSVKTKVHVPRSPSALLSATEREKVFLEVHIQNLTQDTMWFERMRFECADGWSVEDGNTITQDDTHSTRIEEDEKAGIFSGSSALMQPQDVRQYIYILSPSHIPLVPSVPAPGSIIALGRLDISWRSSFGEPGRLLTSMLSRRIPLPPAPAQQPASALPPYLKRNTMGATATPPRPHSPQQSLTQSQSRPGTPPAPHRPGSPFRNINRSSAPVPARPQSPAPATGYTVPPLPSSEVDVTLVVRDIPRASITVEKPFTIPLVLTISMPPSPIAPSRKLSLVVQHLQPPRISPVSPPIPALDTSTFSPRSQQLSLSGFTSPSPTFATFNYALAHQKLLGQQQRQDGLEEININPNRLDNGVVMLPAPTFNGPDELNTSKSTSGVAFLGASTVFLPPIELTPPSIKPPSDEADDDATPLVQRNYTATQEFELSYLPLRRGFTTLGGLRVLLIDDKAGSEKLDEDEAGGMRKAPEVRVLKEWDVIGEVWVKS